MKKGLKAAYYLVSIVIVTGFYFHKSDDPQVFIYSYRYSIVLLILTLGFLVVIPYVLRKIINKAGVENLAVSCISALMISTVVYMVFHFKYYAQSQHLFDPYLQIHKRNFESDEVKKQGEYLILCLGGSTTEEGYPEVLQEELGKRFPQLKIRTFNAGKQWYTSKHLLISYVTYYRKMKPDMVIVMEAINDVVRSFSPSEYACGDYNVDYSHFYGPSINGAVPKTFEGNFYRTYLSFIRIYWFSIFFYEYRETNFPLPVYKSIDAFEYYLTTLVQCVKKDNTKCIILEQPYLYKERMSEDELNRLHFGYNLCHTDTTYASPESLGNAMAAYNDIARKIALNEQVLFVETKTMKKDLEHFYDDVHYTEKGTSALVELIAQKIDSSGIILTQ